MFSYAILIICCLLLYFGQSRVPAACPGLAHVGHFGGVLQGSVLGGFLSIVCRWRGLCRFLLGVQTSSIYGTVLVLGWTAWRGWFREPWWLLLGIARFWRRAWLFSVGFYHHLVLGPWTVVPSWLLDQQVGIRCLLLNLGWGRYGSLLWARLQTWRLHLISNCFSTLSSRSFLFCDDEVGYTLRYPWCVHFVPALTWQMVPFFGRRDIRGKILWISLLPVGTKPYREFSLNPCLCGV